MSIVRTSDVETGGFLQWLHTSGKWISDREGRGPAGRHARNPPANPDYLGTAGQACAAGLRRILEAKLPRSTTVLFDECGYLPQLEQPRQFTPLFSIF